MKTPTLKIFRSILFIASILMIASCNKINEEVINEVEASIYPENFDFKTTSETSLLVRTLDNRNEPISNVPLQLFQIDEGIKTLIASGQSNQNGEYVLDYEIGNHIDSVEVTTNYIGLLSSTMVELNSSMQVTLGGEINYQKTGVVNGSSNGRVEANDLFYMGNYDNNGVPYYLEPVNDYVSQDLLDIVNNSLPEGYPVPTYNPEYIVDSVSSDTKLRDSAEVWVTFVHEGAGWRNALGYYTYDLNNPPASVDDIDSLHVIFPNVSFSGSGGALASGSKVHLGSFTANTGIGWFLVPNGWNGSSVSYKNQTKFSNRNFNSFTSETYRTHTVLLKDSERELLLLGMEDTSRPAGDNDFNDAVFYITANPFSAIITTSLEETTTDQSEDIDGDGVSDKNDAYPNDADKAFNIYTPGKDVFGSVAFEDLYPSKGDFDMNDLIIDYNFQNIANVSNKIVEMVATFKLKALGASIHSGFAFTLPIAPSKIASITGQNIELNDELSIANNGTEDGQSNSVIILFEDGFRVWEGAFGQTNTIPNNGYLNPLELQLTISFSEPVSILELGYAPYDPFIFNSENRAVEVHLVNGTPTDKANLDLGAIWSLSDDRLDNSAYKTFDNLPYAINLPTSFDYPNEGESMSEAFIHFDTWAKSSNLNYTDWYVNKNGYRLTSKIYDQE